MLVLVNVRLSGIDARSVFMLVGLIVRMPVRVMHALVDMLVRVAL